MKTILAVDDHPDILREYMAVLGNAYNVLLADGPSSALAIIERRPVGSIDLLLTDLNMSKMESDKLIKEAYRLRPKIKFILTSNADQSETLPYLEQLKAEGVPDVRFFEKSKIGDDLVDLLSRLLENK